MQHRRRIRLGWVYGGVNVASLQHCVELYPRKRRLLHTIGFMPVPYCPVRPLDRLPPHLTPPHHPLPHCLLLKVTQSKLGQSSQVKQKRRGPIAVETGLCSVSSLFLSASPQPPPLSAPHLRPLNFLTSSPLRVSCVAYDATQQRGPGQGGHD